MENLRKRWFTGGVHTKMKIEVPIRVREIIETLQATNRTLIDTLDELAQIQADGRQKRAAAEQELGRIEGELKQKLLEIHKS